MTSRVIYELGGGYEMKTVSFINTHTKIINDANVATTGSTQKFSSVSFATVLFSFPGLSVLLPGVKPPFLLGVL